MRSRLKLNEEHLWVEGSNGNFKVGISHYIQREIGKILYIDLPQVGDVIERGGIMGEVSSKDVTHELVSPISGSIVEVNVDLEDEIEILNEDPYGDGWLVEVEPSDMSELDTLLNFEEYETLIHK